MAWAAVNIGWQSAAAMFVGLSGTGYLIFQKGWADPTVWVPILAVAFPFLLEIMKRRDSRSDKDRDREQSYEDRMQRLYEREIQGLERELADVRGKLKESEEDRERMRDELRRTPPSRRPRKDGGDGEH